MSQSHSSILLTNRRGGYEPLDEEFQVTDADWKWLLTHTEYTEPELRNMLHGEELRILSQARCQTSDPAHILGQDYYSEALTLLAF